MATKAQPDLAVWGEINLLPLGQTREAAARARWSQLASVGLHLFAAALLVFTPLGRGTVQDVTRVLVDLKEPITLIAPPSELTQAAPNVGKVGKEFNLESLLPRPRLFSPPAEKPGAPPVVAVLPEPPPIQASIPDLLAFGEVPEGVRLPPPQIQPVEKPKLTLQPPGSQAGLGAVKPPAALPAPSAPVGELARDLARGRGTSPLVVEDFGPAPGAFDPGWPAAPSPTRTGSSLELLSDPRGVDFKPYLVRILASVKRNWMAVIPESARLGRRGRVVLQFIINKDGSVPRLVIASASGTEALDRAAVAGISATNPFPPLPDDFRGDSIRLQFVFLYNMPR